MKERMNQKRREVRLAQLKQKKKKKPLVTLEDVALIFFWSMATVFVITTLVKVFA